MKKIIKKLPNVVLGLIACFMFVLSSCDKMNDIQQEYADRAETVYLGKVDSIEYFPGFGRAKITWYISSDPKIGRTVIYWNMRQDSVVKEVNRSGSGVYKDSVILDNLPEGSTLFEFRNTNDRGETSLFSTASVSVWGLEFGDGLRARRLQAFDYDNQQAIYNLTISESSAGDSVLFSEIVYTNTLNELKTVKIERDDNEVALDNFPDGGEFQFRTVFFPPQGIDTVYNDFQTFRAPEAVLDQGMKIALQGNAESRYFDQYGALLYEWNANGDLIEYTLGVDGELIQAASYPALAPRTSYRDFFFYDDDKFIGITTGDGVAMLQFEEGILSQVGPATFGAGFAFPQFMSTRGFFFSRSAAGAIQTWVARNNATWGVPNGTNRGDGYDAYGVMALFNHELMLAVDEHGYLWSIPYTVSGTLGSRSRVGSGWDRFERIFSVGTTLYGMEANGDIYVFNHFNAADNFWVID